MNRKLTATFIIVSFLCLLIYACKKDKHSDNAANQAITDPSIPMSVALAKKYYHNLRKEEGDKVTSTKTQTSAGRPQNRKYILFKASYTSQTPTHTFVEVPLFYNQKVGTILKTPGKDFSRSDDLPVFQAELNRLVIYKDKKTGQVGQRIITYIPDKEYLARHNNDISHNHINKLDKDFSGFIKYRNWAGRTIFVLKILNGKSVKRYFTGYNKSKTKKASVKDEVCQDYVDITILTVCYYADPEGETEICEETIIDEYYHTECYDDGFGDPDCFETGDCSEPECKSCDPQEPTTPQ